MNALRHLPSELQRELGDSIIDQTHEGMSGTSVFRLESHQQPDRYLKVAARCSEQDLHPELSRLLWLQGRLPVPQVLYWSEDAERQYLLISALPGLVLYDDAIREHLPSLIRLYASGLRQIHALRGCPFDARLDVKIDIAARRLHEGALDAANFSKERTAKSAFRELLDTRPEETDLVFAHGDYCTPNLLVDPETLKLNGFIDWGRAGVADRYLDLAIAGRSIDYNFGSEWVEPFFLAYGITDIDHAKVKFYRLLDEFF